MSRLQPAPSIAPSMLRGAIDWAVVSRRSIRAFLPAEVDREEVNAILDVARHAASGVNTQPWRVQVAFTKFHRVIAAELGIPDVEMVVCGMSLGYADPSRIENSLVTHRESVGSFTTYHE